MCGGVVPSLCVLALAACGRIGFTPALVERDADIDTDAIDADADADAAVSGACPAFATFCDGFETGDLSRWTSVALQGTGTFAVNATRVRTGASALESRAEVAAADGARAAPVLRFPLRSTGVLAARQWINLDRPLSEFNVILQFANSMTSQYATVAGDFSARWVATEDSTAGQRDHMTTIPTPALNTWTCVELVVTFQVPGPRRLEIFADGVRVLDATPFDPAPAYDELSVGIARGDMAGFEIFVDDVVLADQRVGCGNGS
jgi:hypothetical protein